MFGGGNMMGKQYDNFMYAAMLSRAKIEQAWSGQAPDEAPEELAQPREDAPAFDPEMLKKLAQRAADGELPEAAPAAAALAASSSASTSVATSSTSVPVSTNSNPYAGFAPEVVAAAAPFIKLVEERKAAGSVVPAAFRRRAPINVSQEVSACVPLAFLRNRRSQSSGSAPYDPMAPPDPWDGGFQMQFKGPGEEEQKKTDSAAAVNAIVSQKLAQAQSALDSTKNYLAVAPEPVQPKPRRSRWGNDDAAPEGGSSDKAGGTSLPNELSARELAALARGESAPDAPALGELRAPGSSAKEKDQFEKTGAQAAREARQERLGYRERSRDRKRRRSPSSSSERRGSKQKLFTSKPAYRLTGSTIANPSSTRKRGGFDSAPEAPAPAAGAAPGMGGADLPDWLKDMAEPAVTTASKLGKKYLHMPRLMIEVLTHNGGDALENAQKRSQCQMKIETMIEEPVGIISVNGNYQLGESVLRETLANKGLELPPQDGVVLPYAAPTMNRAADTQQDVTIPDSLVRHFVGHRGCNMKAIHHELDRLHGARTVSIQILPAVLPGGLRRIQITGSNRIQARELVIRHIEDLKKQKLTMGQSNDTHTQATPAHWHAGNPSGVRI